jgi:hypothetical protein
MEEVLMAGETPEAWIGQEVSLHLWKSEDLGTEAHSAVLRGIDSSGVTVEGSQGHDLTFYPWSTVREITLGQNQDSG